MIDWTLVGNVAIGVVVAVGGLLLLWVVVSLLAAGIYIAWYYLCVEWPDSIRWWWRTRHERTDAGTDRG